MKIVHNPYEAYAHVDQWRRQGVRIGVVPTMGALHAGHESLVKRSVEANDVTVVSIFVNPTQFGPHEDFSRYPRTLESDLGLLRNSGVDLVFAPSQPMMYPEGFSTFVQPPAVATQLEGVFRPDHYRGVVTVVIKLFQILPAQIAYFGQKDYQQYLVIRRMVEDLNLPIRMECCPTVRHEDGLAMSSRNRQLDKEQRRRALSLWKALRAAQDLIFSGTLDVPSLEKSMKDTLYSEGADRVDYARIVERETLLPMERIDRPAIALIAAHLGSTRLIDNLMLDFVKESNSSVPSAPQQERA